MNKVFMFPLEGKDELQVTNDYISRVELIGRILFTTRFYMPYDKWKAMLEEIRDMPRSEYWEEVEG